VSDHPEHELTLTLLAAVAEELDADEQAELLSDRTLIEDLLALGSNPTPEQIAGWMRDADHY
jgi:hypothetical protein